MARSQAFSQTRSALYSEYVNSKKESDEHHEACFRAFRDVLIAGFVELRDNMPVFRLFLAEHLEDEELTSACYRKKHRNVFEYLLGISRRELIASLQEDLRDLAI